MADFLKALPLINQHTATHLLISGLVVVLSQCIPDCGYSWTEIEELHSLTHNNFIRILYLIFLDENFPQCFLIEPLSFEHKAARFDGVISNLRILPFS